MYPAQPEGQNQTVLYLFSVKHWARLVRVYISEYRTELYIIHECSFYVLSLKHLTVKLLWHKDWVILFDLTRTCKEF